MLGILPPERDSMTTLVLDHLVVVAPTLAEGAAHVRDQIGMEMQPGGKHPEMGTHNLLLRLGDDVFLEVIALDPIAAKPTGLCWFGLADEAAVHADWMSGRRLRGFVARTDDFDGVLARHGELVGRKTPVSRGDRRWFFSVRPDGSLPADGAAPPVIDWGPRGCPAPDMPDVGALLVGFDIKHPDPAWLEGLYARLSFTNPPAVRRGAAIRLRATINTPSGVRELR
jgi:Glyoxalase-like domain